MLSRTERTLLITLIRDRVATLPPESAQVDVLHALCTKIESGGELLTVSEVQYVLNAVGEPDDRRCRWTVYASDVSVFTDILNAMQMRHAITGRNIINA